jgi:Cys-tRNA(Pro)/Cys-tRNA(Cys) deacylase
MPGRATPATALLDRLGIAYRLHSYTTEEHSGSYGWDAAASLGVPPARCYKTLVADVGGALTGGVVPVAGKLDLKALAAAVGGKKATMASPAAAERATGYVPGGISPLGQRARLPLVLDGTASAFETIYCSAGRRGLQMELAPRDLLALSGGTTAPIAAGL